MAVFDLNARRKEAKAEREPFELKVEQKKFTFAHPNDVDWKDLNAGMQAAQLYNNPEPMLRALLGDDFERFADVKISGAELQDVMDAYYKHHGVTPGE